MIGYQSYQILRKGIEPWALQAKVKKKGKSDKKGSKNAKIRFISVKSRLL